MQQLPCPWCGPRAQIEFSYVRDWQAVPAGWPEADAPALERIYLRSNHIGWHIELWQHSAGCRGWLKLLRHNLTHEVRAAVPVDRALELPE